MRQKEENFLLLLSIGLDDLTLSKGDCQEKNIGNDCSQNDFYYHGIDNDVCGNETFKIDKLIVIQMK